MSLVSVYIPTKNRLASLQAAVNSVLQQTHREVELIVTDDASTDGTWEYLQALSAQHANVRCIRHETSKGACAARNAAIQLSRGDFLTGLDDDDEFEVDHIESLLSFWFMLTAQDRKAPSCIYTQTVNRNGDQKTESKKISAVMHTELADANHIGNQIFAPREHFFSAGLFDESMPAWQDLEFFYRVVKNHGIARLLDKATYVFDVAPRPDRISSSNKHRILQAAYLMAKAHGPHDARFRQRLLWQVYGKHYGFSIDLKDVWLFCSINVISLQSLRFLRAYFVQQIKHLRRQVAQANFLRAR